MKYYDALLFTIPLFLFSGVASGIVLQGIPMEMSLGVASVIATAMVGHGLFIRGPHKLGSMVESTPERVQAE